jgi:hypothetical protein
VLACSLPAADSIAVDENAMFADTSSITSADSLVNNAATIDRQKEKKSVGFSGAVTSFATATAERDWFYHGAHAADTRFSAGIVGNLMLDARLLQGIKTFADVEADYTPTDSASPHFYLRELFVDANIAHHVYLRTGKQVLQWGRCYFWNPVDLINIEQKTFITKIGHREGTYGVKLHVPFGTVVNLYGFFDMHNITRLDSMAGAAKLEVLAGRTEAALSCWDRRGRDPVYGLDFSTRLFTVDIAGECALYQTYYARKLGTQNGLPAIVTDENHWVPRASVNLSRSFALLGVPDRLSLTTEFYYNGAGVKGERVDVPPEARELARLALGRDATGAELQMVLAESGLYEPNSYSRFYAALFTSVSKFILPDMTLSLNGMMNLEHRSAILSAGLSYATLGDFTFGLSVNGFVGPKNTEYTFAGDAMQVQLTAGVVF